MNEEELKKGCGKDVWNDRCKSFGYCGQQLGFPNDYLFCPSCQKLDEEEILGEEKGK